MDAFTPDQNRDLERLADFYFRVKWVFSYAHCLDFPSKDVIPYLTKSLGLSQAQLARLSGVSKSTISRAAKDGRNLSPASLSALRAAVYRVQLEESGHLD